MDETLERLAAQGKRAKLLYTVPDHHNPTGATMPLAVREKLVEVCARHRVFIMEDMAYTELYFDAPPPPSLYAVADGHGVIQVGSFSKIIATGLRVGWVQARLPVIESLGRVRFDMGGSPLLHRALAHYAGSGDLETHVDMLRGIYRRKCATLVSSLRENCHPHLRFEEPAGGFFLWAECVGASAQDVAREAAEEGLVFAMGSNFFRDRGGGGHLASPAGAELRVGGGAGGGGAALPACVRAGGGVGGRACPPELSQADAEPHPSLPQQTGEGVSPA